jgi:hypothetical protein
MQILRRHKGLFASLAGLAMLAHVLAASLCPNMTSHSRMARYYDSALGWVTLCLSGPTAATSDQNGLGGKGGSPGHDGGHGGLCAALCAAVVATLAAVIAIVISAFVFSTVSPAIFLIRREHARRHSLFGGIGSRAPPALV